MKIYEIQYGYCHCGCGNKTKIETSNCASRNQVKGEPRKFLNGHGARSGTPEEGFWEKVEVRSPDECWTWLGNPNVNGYGTFSVRGREMYAHRYSWILRNGPIPDINEHRGTMVIRHKCDNPICVNPNHLELGRQVDNLMDCVKRGRRPKKYDHWNAKLRDEEVSEIRRLRLLGVQGLLVSKMFKVTQSTVSRIVHYLGR